MKKIYSLPIIILLLSAACTKQTSAPLSPYNTPMQVGGKNILVQVVSTPADKAQGLSGREQLQDNQGMLFDFRNSETARPGFWMKDMKFDLDFIWINQNKIIDITPNIAAPTSSSAQLPVYYPPSDVDMVLEVSAGWTKKNKIKIGDEVRLN